MVSGAQVLIHYTGVADEINKTLSEFGDSCGLPGFWCEYDWPSRKSVMGCIYCPRANYCPASRSRPILEKKFNPDSKGWARDLDDIGFFYLIEQAKSVKDWVWLQHPESRSPLKTAEFLHDAKWSNERDNIRLYGGTK